MRNILKIIWLVSVLLAAPAHAQFNGGGFGGGGGAGSSYTFGSGLTNTAGAVTLGDAGLGYSAGVLDLSTSLGLGSKTAPIAVLSAPGAGEFELSVGGSDVLDYGVTTSGALTASGGILVGRDQFNGGIGIAPFNNGSYPSGIELASTNGVWLAALEAIGGIYNSPSGAEIAVGGYYSFAAAGGPTNSADTAISRAAAGVVAAVNTAAVGAGYFEGAAWEAGIVYSVAGTAVPSASTLGKGARIFVSDATACALGTTYTGSGSTACPLYSDGTNWKEGG